MHAFRSGFVTLAANALLCAILPACNDTSGSGSNMSSATASTPATAGITGSTSSSSSSGSSGGSGSGSPPPVPASAGIVSFVTASYTVSEAAGTIMITASRSGGTAGAVSVRYSSTDGSAIAGVNYAATSGTLSWNDGDTGARSVAVAIKATPAFTGTRSFTVTLAAASTATSVGTPAVAQVSIQGTGSANSALSVRVQGNHLVDGNGNSLQLRGADVSGLEFVAIQGWSPSNPWGGLNANYQAMRSWKLNVVRFPLNESSWLGTTTYDWPTTAGAAGTTRDPDPGHNYRQTVIDSVNAAVAAGLYVVLDMHISAPDAVVPGIAGKVPTSATVQNAMADADRAAAFWTSLASAFKDNPAVIFDLFNEPHIDNFLNVTGYRDPSAWAALRDGGTATQFITNGVTVSQNFQTAGMQSMVNAVRATGATNVIMAAGISWAQDTSQWVAYAPVDPAGQLAASWHAYPQGSSGVAASVPGWGTDNYTWAQAIVAAGYPVVIGETGDISADGTAVAPLMANLLPWADKYNVSVIGWAWNVAGSPQDDLIKDAAGTPTDGYGRAFHDWAFNHP